MDNFQLYQYIRPRKVCLCIGLSRQDIIDAITKFRIHTIEELKEKTQCCTGCGTCESEIKNILHSYYQNHSTSQ